MTVPSPPLQDDPDFLEAQAEVSRSAVPGLKACLGLAKAYQERQDHGRAARWAFAAIDAGDDFAGWLAAARIVRRGQAHGLPAMRPVRLAVLGSYTTSQLTSLLPLAAARSGMEATTYESGYGLYRLEVLDPGSAFYAFKPDVVVVAIHEAEVALPSFSADPEAAVEEELLRWTSLWDQIEQRCGARVVQHNVAIAPEVSLGHLATRTPGSRFSMLQRLNQRLGEAADGRVAIVDCERLSAAVGKNQWFNARYFHAAKQAVALNSVPTLARHTAAVVAATLGLSKKVLVLDLDNTLWGGVLGEVGPAGILVGSGPVGEAFSAFQRYILELKDKGIVLAVCSKNNEADVREVFATNPDMLVKLDDIAMLAAGWDDKPSVIRRIAATLDVGLDSMVFVDDNPAEREAVRMLVPEVDVIPLPTQPADYVRALSSYPLFETAALTAEDSARTQQYQARAQAASLQEASGSVEEYLASLDMRADLASLGGANITRVTQLIGKTNQFNLTSHRYSLAEVENISRDAGWVTQVVRLRDRFADHGIVGVLLAEQHDDTLAIDTWLMSCRVIGRTLEDEMLWHLVDVAERLGCRRITGSYRPTAKNVLVADLLGRLGFTQLTGDEPDEATEWELLLPQHRSTASVIALHAVQTREAMAS